jgi:hypothetical protein
LNKKTQTFTEKQVLPSLSLKPFTLSLATRSEKKSQSFTEKQVLPALPSKPFALFLATEQMESHKASQKGRFCLHSLRNPLLSFYRTNGKSQRFTEKQALPSLPSKPFPLSLATG